MLVIECFTSLVVMISVFTTITESTPVLVDVSPRVFRQPSSHDSGFYYWHWIHTTTGGLLAIECFTIAVVMISVLTWFNLCYCRNLLVPHWIIHPAVSVYALTWLIIFIYYWKHSYLSQSRIGHLIYSLPNTFELCVFPILWAYYT